MAFDKAYLKLKKNNPRGIPDEYTYWGRDDTIAQITAAGYFDESAFATKEDPRRNLTDPPDTDAYAIHVQASDGSYEVQLAGGVASVVGATNRAKDLSELGVIYGSSDSQHEAFQSAIDSCESRGITLIQSGDVTVKGNIYLGNIKFFRR